MIHAPALVLNADYQPLSFYPLSVWPWQDAIRAVVKGIVNVVAEYDHVVRSPSVEMKIPSVVALMRYQPTPRHVAFTRFNVFLRDRFCCQYCGKLFRSDLLTFDHVVPRSRGGETSWDNVVAACEPCNARKDNRQDMRPFRVPKMPSARELMVARKAFIPDTLHDTWISYLYWDSELER